jgi:hypothetical protein
MSLPTFNETTSLVGQSRSAYAALLKEYYADMWDLHVHTRGIVMSTIGGKKGRMGGRRVVAAFVDELPQSSGISGLEGVRLPTPSVGSYANPTIPARGLFTVLRWTVEVELAARAGNKAAFARPRRMDVQHAREQMDIQMDRKAYLGKYDVLGVASGPDTGTSPDFVIPLHPRNDRTASGSAAYYAGSFYMRKNKYVAIIDSAEGARGGPVSTMAQTDPSAAINAVQITAKGGTTDAPTITVSTDPATLHGSELADGDLIVEYGNRRGVAADLPGNQEDYASFNGLDDIATDATREPTIFGLSKTTYPTLSGVYDNNSGTVRPYREARVMLIVDRINDEGTGNSPDVLLTNRATRREVVNEHDGDRRYAPVVTKSGFGQLVAHVGDVQMPIKSDWQCPPGLMWAVRKSTFGWCSLADMQPVDQQYERFVTGLAAHEMLWHKHGNIWCPTPFDSGCIDDIEFNAYALQGE